MTLAGKMATFLMERAPSEAPATDAPGFSQIFDHDDYVNGSEEHRRAVRYGSSSYRYAYESGDGMFAKFFPDYPLEELRGTRFLDLGCLTGGRTAAWTDELGLGQAFGFDIDVEFVRAAKECGEHHGHDSHFCVSLGESMPFADNSFDAIATFDVLEHVQDVSSVLAEAHRVLKPGGVLFAVFPTYYNPLASHLNLATRMHGLNILFSGRALAEAHHEVIRRRGEDHQWYNSDSATLPSFYKAPFLNGITVKRFREILDENPWQVEHWPRKPIFTVGKRMQRPFFRALSRALKPLASVPVVEELFLTSVSIVVRKAE